MFTTGAAIPSLPGSSRRTLEMASQQVICGDCPDWAIDITKREYSQQQAHHGVTVSPQPVEIALRSGLPHEQHDGDPIATLSRLAAGKQLRHGGPAAGNIRVSLYLWPNQGSRHILPAAKPFLKFSGKNLGVTGLLPQL